MVRRKCQKYQNRTLTRLHMHTCISKIIKIFNTHVSPPFREPIQHDLFTSILWLEICQCNNSVTILDTLHHVVTTVFSTAVSKKNVHGYRLKNAQIMGDRGEGGGEDRAIIKTQLLCLLTTVCFQSGTYNN